MEESKLAVALRPLLLMIRCCGFNLNEHSSHKTIERIYSTICFGLFTAATIFRFSLQWAEHSRLEWNIGKIKALIARINSDLINGIFIYTVFYVLSWSGIPNLWKALRQFEEFHYFDGKFYQNIRKQSWMAVVYTFFCVSSNKRPFKSNLNSFHFYFHAIGNFYVDYYTLFGKCEL